MAKISLLYILVAVLLLCEVVLPHVSALSNSYYRKLKAAAATRLRTRECRDDEWTHATCTKVIKELGYKVCLTQIPQLKAKLQRSCAATCKFCGKPHQNCRTSEFGCCWDAYTPSADLYGIKGCPECKDHLRLCHRFRDFCAKGKSDNNNSFMELHCPKTCGKCSPRRGVPIRGKKIKMTDWNRL